MVTKENHCIVLSAPMPNHQLPIAKATFIEYLGIYFFFFFGVSGIYPYRAQISGLRLMILSCMTELSMEVLKITKHPNEGTIKVRWRIKGIPLLRRAVSFIGRRLKASSEGYR